MKVYIAGPMTGIPDANYPFFNRIAAALRDRGHEVINPAENLMPLCNTWAGFMRMSIKQIATVEALVMLPKWENSRGARLEAHIAKELGMPIYSLRDMFPEGA
ncbi:MAG: hypothetical protein JWR07_1937 [Nevskia sp.]|nr:hypothetical protein [Nevskia sp.]